MEQDNSIASSSILMEYHSNQNENPNMINYLDIPLSNRPESIITTTTNHSNIIMCNHEEEISNLKKQLRLQEIQAIKEKAVFEQKIEILEQQLQEARNREENINKMNQTILSAINDINSNSNMPTRKTVRELELATEQHNKEMAEHRARTSEIIRNLENENKNLKEKLNDNELSIKELRLNIEKFQMDTQKRASEYENEISTLQKKNRTLEDEKTKQKEMYEYEMQLRINELKTQNDRLKENHRKEIEKIQSNSETSLAEMKNLYQNEKSLLEARLEKVQTALEKEETEIIIQLKENYEKEISELNKKLEESRTQYDEEIKTLKKQRDDANDKTEKADQNLKKLRLTLRTTQSLQEQNNKVLQQKLEKAKSIGENGENLIEENKKNKHKILELKNQIKKLEQTEKQLRDIISEKERRPDDEQLEFSQILQADTPAATMTPNMRFNSNNNNNNFKNESNLKGKPKSHKTSQAYEDDPLLEAYESNGRSGTYTRKSSANNQKSCGRIQNDENSIKTKSFNQLESKNNSRPKTRSKSPQNDIQKNFQKFPNNESIVGKKNWNMIPNGSKSQQRYAADDRLDISQTSIQGMISDKSYQTTGNAFNKGNFLQNEFQERMPYAMENRYHSTESRNKFDTQSYKKCNSGKNYIKKNYQNIQDKDEQTIVTDDEIDLQDEEYIGPPLQNKYFNTTNTNNNPKPTSEILYDTFPDETPSIAFYTNSRPGHSNVRGSQIINGNGCSHDSMYFSIAMEPSSQQTQESKMINNNMYSSIKLQSSKPNHCSSISSSIGVSASKQQIEEKLKDIELKLREVEIRNKGLKVEKSKVEIELEKLLMELREKNENGELKSEEGITHLRNEVKFLLGVIMGKSKDSNSYNNYDSAQINSRLETLINNYSNNNNNGQKCNNDLLIEQTISIVSSKTMSKDNSTATLENLPHTVQSKSSLEYNQRSILKDHNKQEITPTTTPIPPSRNLIPKKLLNTTNNTNTIEGNETITSRNHHHYQYNQSISTTRFNNENNPNYYYHRGEAKLIEIMKKRSNHMRESISSKINQSFQEYSMNNNTMMMSNINANGNNSSIGMGISNSINNGNGTNNSSMMNSNYPNFQMTKSICINNRK